MFPTYITATGEQMRCVACRLVAPDVRDYDLEAADGVGRMTIRLVWPSRMTVGDEYHVSTQHESNRA